MPKPKSAPGTVERVLLIAGLKSFLDAGYGLTIEVVLGDRLLKCLENPGQHFSTAEFTSRESAIRNQRSRS